LSACDPFLDTSRKKWFLANQAPHGYLVNHVQKQYLTLPPI
jgi:hypothetical protein